MQYLGDNLAKTYKRKKLKLSVNKVSSESVTCPEDMDLESDSDNQDLLPPPNQGNSGHASNSLEKISDEVSLNDLEQQKSKLLEALEEQDSANDKQTIEQNIQELNQSFTQSRPMTPSAQQNIGASKETLTGTPLIKSVTPFLKLPEDSKWSAGVSDVIDFENLPDSVGTYKKLSSVIDKVRNVVKQINDENDAEDDNL